MKNLLLIGLVISFCISCSSKRNKLNTDEQQLANKILNSEKVKQEEELEKKVSQTIQDTFPPDFRFKEDRSVDPNNPPVHIDVLGTQENARNFKLSDFASSIQYIKLQAPPDSTLTWTHPKLSIDDFTVFSNDKNIFVNWIFGLARFTPNGNFQELIWRNESGIELGEHGFNWSPNELFGISRFNPVSSFNDHLYIRFIDSRNNQIQFVKQKVSNQPTFSINSNDIENQTNAIPGEKLFSIKGSVYDRSYETTFGLSENCWAGLNNTYESAKTGSVFTVFSNSGDTLCLLSSAHQIKNRTSPQVADNKSFTWHFKNRLTFLEQYSDTIFRIIPPNKMLPVYILDFGKDKVSFKEGVVNPTTDLSQKLLPYSIVETDNYLFIRYTRNSAGLRNLRKNAVKFHNSIFDKNKNRYEHSPEHSLRAKNILNDLDGGLPFWPEFVTPEGKMFMPISGEMLKEYVNSADFKTKQMSEDQRQKQMEIANQLNNEDKVVMVVK